MPVAGYTILKSLAIGYQLILFDGNKPNMKNFLWLMPATLLFLLVGCAPGAPGVIVPVTAIPNGEPADVAPSETVRPKPSTAPTLVATATVAVVAPAAELEGEVAALAVTPAFRDDLPQGESAAIAYATDVATSPDREPAHTFADEEIVALQFSEFYDGFDLRKGLILSDKLVALDGKQVEIIGYMAPPLKAELDFFVLTKTRLEYCPFCSKAADWPDHIVMVYLLNDPVEVTNNLVKVRGQLELGVSVDEESGMISLVRIYADQIELVSP